MKKKIRIFTDFDATISINDVGDAIFETFTIGDWKRPMDEWKNGKLSSKDVYIQECAITRVTEQQLKLFCDQQAIDPFFKDFVLFCQTNSFPLTILSDGLDYYIYRILQNNELNFLPVIANELFFENPNRIRIEFPYYGKGCPMCANCKGYHVENACKNGELIVFIGDGQSDRCGVEHADVIFAKDELREYCEREGIQFNDFTNFNDVLNILVKIVL
jgi:2,3-diketo-5-methylthio-1-phosphopentane phosphatase